MNLQMALKVDISYVLTAVISLHHIKQCMKQLHFVRNERKPLLVHATVPLLGHHTSGVRKEFYRSKEDLEAHALRDPYPKLRYILEQHNISDEEISHIEQEAKTCASTSI
jgi:TPP-dependent pyruvate/acetoin dehydrogenase alpha subunit